MNVAALSFWSYNYKGRRKPTIIAKGDKGVEHFSARPTMMVVEVEEDWTSTVTSTPIITPTTGLFRREESAKNAGFKYYQII